MTKKLKMALAGGGPGAFIGAVHRIAAELDGEIELVSGVFSSDPERSLQGGRGYGLSDERIYPNIEALVKAETARPDGADFVTIATPNHTHFSIAKTALEGGLAVMSDKPMTATLAEAEALGEVVEQCGRPFGLTYTYTGYPLARHAKVLIAEGEIGEVRKAFVEYPQGWLATPLEQTTSKQAGWRADPARSGPGGAISDIGVHAFNMAEFVTGLEVERLAADLAAIVPGRKLDDDCTVLLRFSGGVRGVLMASQIEIGALNGLAFKIHGSKGALHWRQEEPNKLWLHRLDGRTELIRTADPGLSPAAVLSTRLPGGHPEGYLEAFANLYRDFAAVLRGGAPPLLPGFKAGLRSMRFIETAVFASRSGAGWVDFNP